MDIAAHLVVFVAGLAALIVGGDGLVRGAAAIARTLGISPLVVGLTVVAFGTSAPELAVSLTSGLSDYADLALGNVVGSNIFNILLILGIAALLNPLKVERQLVRFDIPVMIASAILLTVLSLDGVISRVEGAILAALLVGYITTTVITARKAKQNGATREAEEAEEAALERMDWMLSGVAFVLTGVALAAERLDMGIGLALAGSLVAYLVAATTAGKRPGHLPLNGAMLVFAIGAVALSARCMVEGAVGIARMFDISEAVIGLTVVAAGTSLPEAVTTVAAGRQGESDIAIGNVVGSNIFNVLCIVGVTGSVVALPVSDDLLRFDYAVMVAVMLGLWPLLWLRKRVGVPDGILMLVVFAGYMAVQLARVM
ncbi:MAG: calcium/sodium antiporter [Myxococcales bacterium]|nr:calcium/sodium antiporter [Myxococcales bacterium]